MKEKEKEEEEKNENEKRDQSTFPDYNTIVINKMMMRWDDLR